MQILRIIAIAGLLTAVGAMPRAQTPQPTGIILHAAAAAPGKPLVHYWSKVVGAGRANEALRATWQDELKTVHDAAGFQYVRFHGIFHDDMFVYREDKDGHPIYNFQYVDDVFDRMLATGVKPFVELGFVPSELATVTDTDFWWKANGSPPKDYDKWAALVSHLIQHCIARYGLAEVRSWYFEVWNEPNLRYFFKNGTQAQYFELYKITAQTIKEIDPQLRVGGPATSNFHIPDVARGKDTVVQLAANAVATGEGGDWQPIWVEDFLNYCAANHLPVDFVSTHPYPTDFPLDVAGEPQSRVRRNIDSTKTDLTTLRKIVDRSAFPNAEIQLTEWNSSPSPLDHSHDSLAAAAFIVKTNLESTGLVDSLSYWVFTDVFEEERNTDSIFHGGFGLINYQQIVKPAFHAYRLMNELGDTALFSTVGGIITRDSQTHRLSALAYNYPVEMNVSLPKAYTVEEADKIVATGSARALSLSLTGLAPGQTFLIETLDKDHGNAVLTWEQMGRPEPPTREQTQLLRQSALATKKEFVHADIHGELHLDRSLAAWTVLLIKQLDGCREKR
jgi:xylan 1,4-beta-xylosidase